MSGSDFVQRVDRAQARFDSLRPQERAALQAQVGALAHRNQKPDSAATDHIDGLCHLLSSLPGVDRVGICDESSDLAPHFAVILFMRGGADLQTTYDAASNLVGRVKWPEGYFLKFR